MDIRRLPVPMAAGAFKRRPLHLRCCGRAFCLDVALVLGHTHERRDLPVPVQLGKQHFVLRACVVQDSCSTLVQHGPGQGRQPTDDRREPVSRIGLKGTTLPPSRSWCVRVHAVRAVCCLVLSGGGGAGQNITTQRDPARLAAVHHRLDVPELLEVGLDRMAGQLCANPDGLQGFRVDVKIAPQRGNPVDPVSDQRFLHLLAGRRDLELRIAQFGVLILLITRTDTS